MDRREFLKRAVPVSTLPLFMGGFSFKAYGRSPLLEALVAGGMSNDRVLVLVQMNGGNDGLNMVIPLDQYAGLALARPNILIPDTKVLRLSGSDGTGLHPGMTGLQSLFDQGKVAIVQGVSYPNPDLSHFRSTDIWLTASASNEILSSGWLGRYLEQEFPLYPSGFPNTDMPDPLALQIGSSVSTALQGNAVNMGLAITSTTATYNIPGGMDTPPDTRAGHELTYVRSVAEQSQLFAAAIRDAAARAPNLSTLYPQRGQNSLADQFRIVAQLIGGGLKTRIYIVNIGGFDTHSGQVVGGATDTGSHATLLSRLSTAIAAFQDDLQLMGKEHRVIGMTFSEFGRRIRSNASNGTDHGIGAPLFVFGSNVKSGIVGANPVIPTDLAGVQNVPMQFDFRSVYFSLLRDWFGTSPEAAESILPGITEALPLIAPSAVLATEEEAHLPSRYVLYQNYPNPFNPSTRIRYALPEHSSIRLEVFSTAGDRVAVLVDGEQGAGEHEVVFEGSRLPSGVYFCRLRAGVFEETKRLVLIR